MKKVYKVGIIGFGMIGKVHAFAYRSVPFFCDPVPLSAEISHVVTAHQETAEKARSITGAAHASCDYLDVTENPDVDIVHICTPNDEHLPALLSALENGKHVYCDKPVLASLERAETVRNALKTYSGVNQVTFHLRFFPSIMRAKELIEAGALGRILQYRIAYLHSSNADPTVPFKWKHTSAGGALLDTGSHIFDLVDYLLGPFESLIGDIQNSVTERPIETGSKEMRKVECEDSVSVLARMKNGSHGILEASKLASGSEDDLRLEIHGEKGAIRFELMNPHFLGFFDGTSSVKPHGGRSGWTSIACGRRYEPPETDFPSAKSTIGWTRAHISSLVNFLQGVATEKSVSPDLSQGLRVQELLDITAKSVKEQRWKTCVPTERGA